LGVSTIVDPRSYRDALKERIKVIEAQKLEHATATGEQHARAVERQQQFEAELDELRGELRRCEEKLQAGQGC
jgi:hypothetical protein